MSLYDQMWNPSEYEPRKQVFLRDLPKNHLLKLKAVKFEWTDYKVYQKLGCLPYERMIIQCLNRFGANAYFTNAECRDIANLFRDCVQTHHVLGYVKRTNPEYFAVNQYSRQKPNFEELGL